MTPEQALAREAIRHTLSSYHLAGDRGRVADLVACFTEDGVLELATGRFEGRAAIEERLSQVRGDRPAAAGPVFLHHHLTTAHLDVADDGTARGSSYFQVVSPVGLDHAGRYADRYVRVGERWLIAQRTVTISWASPDSIVGATAGG